MNAWLYLTTPAATAQDCLFTWWNANQPSRSGTLQEAANDLAGSAVTLLLPIEMASYHQVEVPVRSGRWLKQAILSALEEKLIDELDTVHIARSALQQRRYCGLFVINRERLQAILADLAKYGMEPQQVYMDADCLPGEEPNAIWCNGRWLVGNIPTIRMALSDEERRELPTLLPANISWVNNGYPDDLPADHAKTTTEYDLALHSLQHKGSIDLRQGEFRYTPPQRLTWHLPAAIIFLCFGAVLLHTVGHRLLIEHRTAALHEQNVHEFQQRFADEQRIVNLRQQVSLRKQQPSKDSQGIARRLEQLAQQWTSSGGSAAAIRHVQYRAGEGWTFEVNARAFADLEQIRQGLTQQGLAVQSNSTVRDANGVTSQFRIGE